MKLEEDPSSVYNGSKYILSFKDGRKEYFDIKG
jgi:hypothetical protein